ncbi:DUF1236 domain-containing protein [Rhizobium sp. LCM 4573]|uniref:DUF1236 domain-containing protein n=1 Tax=Rhizobium sp. LCM 4573 TaxID=1848291 RepID=UPI0008DABA7F|nr:DUF1236 domain-containing protein [Rhizobium sp. LCM 4573]OHV84949.1 hypothetical protein LCM4573_04690 [Rhizobium sp. LCM 4573]
MKKLLVMSAAILGLASGAQAQESTVNGAVGGAVTGAIIGGPVGAAVGGAVGAVAGTAIDPPPDRVVTYVREQPLPPQAVIVEQPVVVGRPVPEQVVLMPVPEEPAYAYAVVNEQRVIVDPGSRTVVQVLD